MEAINFVNSIFLSVLNMTPEINKFSVKSIINDELSQLASQSLLHLEKNNYDLFLLEITKRSLDLTNFGKMLKIAIHSMVEKINIKEQIVWAKSLFDDAIQVTMLNEPLNQQTAELLKAMDIDISKFEQSLAAVTPAANYNRLDMVGFNVVLSDTGPELGSIISSPEELKNQITEGTGAQIITLIGQGSEYHQGIFGPIPIPSNKNLIAIISSKMVKSTISDLRMKGVSLTLIVIGFRRELINCIPNRDILNEVFQPFLKIEHQDEINTSVLNEIKISFFNKLTC